MECLKDQTLFLLRDGEGSTAARNHLNECSACAARYRRLDGDLGAIVQVLRENPPPSAAHRFRPFAVRWLPASVALATALLLMWTGVRVWNRSVTPSPQAANAEVWGLFDAFPSNPFLAVEALALELSTGGLGFDEAAVAILEAERPCEWYDAPGIGAGEYSIEDFELSTGAAFAPCMESDQDH